MKTAMTAESTLYDAQTIRERVRAAGVVGAGGAGFPAHVKLQAQVDTFLVNAAECEPMLKVDQQLMAVQAERLIHGVQYAMTATGASSGIIALKEKYQQAINALTPLLPAGIPFLSSDMWRKINATCHDGKKTIVFYDDNNLSTGNDLKENFLGICTLDKGGAARECENYLY